VAESRAPAQAISKKLRVPFEEENISLPNHIPEIGGLTISDPPTQAEVQALRDKAEELADDVRALSTLVHAQRGRWCRSGSVRVG
jgi:hypothetical protein